MSNWAKPGVKCVCVKTIRNNHHVFKLIEKEIYTVTDTAISPSGDTSIAVEGMRNDNGYGPFWHSSQFRPLVSLQQDIAMFNALLAPTPDLVVMPDLEPSHSD